MKISTYSCRVVDDHEFDKYLKNVEILDDLDNRLEYTEYNETGQVLLQEFWTYEKGLITSHKSIDHEMKSVIDKRYSYEGTRLVQEKELYDNDTYQLTKYTYNEKGDLINTYLTD